MKFIQYLAQKIVLYLKEIFLGNKWEMGKTLIEMVSERQLVDNQGHLCAQF